MFIVVYRTHSPYTHREILSGATVVYLSVAFFNKSLV